MKHHRLAAELIFDIFNDFFLFLILKSMNEMKFKSRKLFEVGLGLSHMRNQGKNVDKRTYEQFIMSSLNEGENSKNPRYLVAREYF